jgi:hypothetical protein
MNFKEYILENEDKTYVVIVPGGDPKELKFGSSLMTSGIGTIYKDKQYYLSDVFMSLVVKFKVKKHSKLKNISMQNYTEPHSNQYKNPREYAPIKAYEIPYMQLIDIVEIDINKFRGKLVVPVDGKSYHHCTSKFDLPEDEHGIVIGEALYEYTEELKERFKGLTNGTKPLEEPYRELYKHNHDFRSIVQCIIRYIQKYNLI